MMGADILIGTWGSDVEFETLGRPTKESGILKPSEGRCASQVVSTLA